MSSEQTETTNAAQLVAEIETLQPCPFCGKGAGSVVVMQINYNGARAYCKHCGGSGPEFEQPHDSDWKHEPEAFARNKAQAVAHWNRRTLLSQQLDAPKVESASTCAEGEEETPPEILATRLIDAWCAEKGGKISWRKCIEIVAIVTKQPQAEVDRLLALGADDDGRCEMCGQSIRPAQQSTGSAEPVEAPRQMEKTSAAPVCAGNADAEDARPWRIDIGNHRSQPR